MIHCKRKNGKTEAPKCLPRQKPPIFGQKRPDRFPFEKVTLCRPGHPDWRTLQPLVSGVTGLSGEKMVGTVERARYLLTEHEQQSLEHMLDGLQLETVHRTQSLETTLIPATYSAFLPRCQSAFVQSILGVARRKGASALVIC